MRVSVVKFNFPLGAKIIDFVLKSDFFLRGIFGAAGLGFVMGKFCLGGPNDIVTLLFNFQAKINVVERYGQIFIEAADMIE